MKKILMIIAIVFGLSVGAFAQGGLFQYGPVSDEEYYGAGYRNGIDPLISLPNAHGESNDSEAPLGSGIAVLISLGAAYLVGKKRSEK
ncbi:MAG: hypothetical protein II887_02190 [Bacteroidales bacterium]|nr:hypothetical protein [Bacteroidales bacterium]